MIFLFILLLILIAAFTFPKWWPRVRTMGGGLRNAQWREPKDDGPAPTPADYWIVRWTGRTGSFNSDRRPESALFTTHDDAVRFKEKLEAAFRLIRHTSDTTVRMEKGK